MLSCVEYYYEDGENKIWQNNTIIIIPAIDRTMADLFSTVLAFGFIAAVTCCFSNVFAKRIISQV